jgi:hypothetical protein
MALYSPRAHIASLWREAFALSFKVGLAKGFSRSDSDFNKKEQYEIARSKKYKLINALLDYYFDPEKDKKYVQENRVTKV